MAMPLLSLPDFHILMIWKMITSFAVKVAPCDRWRYSFPPGRISPLVDFLVHFTSLAVLTARWSMPIILVQEMSKNNYVWTGALICIVLLKALVCDEIIHQLVHSVLSGLGLLCCCKRPQTQTLPGWLFCWWGSLPAPIEKLSFKPASIALGGRYTGIALFFL